MKHLLSCAALLFVAKLLTAQEPHITIDTADKKTLFPGTMNNSFLKQGTYSHTTSKGKVYTLPYDNMPCLVPNMRTVTPMPGSVQKAPGNKMPNATPRRELIPKQENPAD